MKIGILSVQGAFIEHEKILKQLGCECVQLRSKKDIDNLDGIVLPGGESTVQGKLLKDLDMLESIKKLILEGIPVLATCAGLILLSEKISEDSTVHLGTLPVTVKRNAYGRQLGSFSKTDNFKPLGDFEMTFIRAPYVVNTSPEVEVLSVVDEKIVAVKYKNQLGLAFHPELGEDYRIHKYFCNMIEQKAAG